MGYRSSRHFRYNAFHTLNVGALITRSIHFWWIFTLCLQGLKKPYNPIIGEMFRCMWPNTANDSKTFFISEQVSHHPPVSAFYCSNRKDGYVIGGTILAKSKFYGMLCAICNYFRKKDPINSLLSGFVISVTFYYIIYSGY